MTRDVSWQRRRASAAMPLLTLASALLALGCLQIGPNATASDAGCADDAGQKVGEQCLTVYTELCRQAARCNIPISSVTDCANSDVAQYCCSSTSCNAWSCQAPSQVSACQADIDTEDCNAVVNNVTPPTCATFTNAQ